MTHFVMMGHIFLGFYNRKGVLHVTFCEGLNPRVSKRNWTVMIAIRSIS